MAKHDDKAKLVTGRAYMNELLDVGYKESANVVGGMAFAGLSIADISSEAGRSFIDFFFGEPLALLHDNREVLLHAPPVARLCCSRQNL